ncbi:MAG: anti-sigma factor family protein [Solirubrobacteraceae bacterium]
MSAEHRQASARLLAYREQTLSSHEDERVRAHLRDCADCRKSLAQLTELADELRAISSPAPEGLAARVIAHLDAGSASARLSVATAPSDTPSPRTPAVAAAWELAREQLPRTLLLSFVAGVAITLLKDLGTLFTDGITVQTCAVCGANFVAAFALLNVWLLLARSRNQPP